MSPHKTDAIVLRTYDYGETSSILHLFSEEFGCLRGIAKGIKRRKPALFPERGSVVNTIAYIKPHRDLHTLGELSIARVYPSIRSDLLKTALRDAGFEVVLRSIRHTEAQPRLYESLIAFLEIVDSHAHGDCFPYALWDFLAEFAGVQGFGLNFQSCVACQGELDLSQGAEIRFAQGGFACKRCGNHRARIFPADVLAYLSRGKSHEMPPPILPGPTLKAITRALVGYCSYHFDITSEYQALPFLEELIV